VNDRRVSDWLTARLPSADNLRQIGQQFDVSVDWLLGFDDVPMQRGERTSIGALSAELSRLVSTRRPPDAYDPKIRDLSTFANEMVDEWWHSCLMSRATEAARKFRELAFEVQKATRGSSEPSEVVDEARHVINQCQWVAGTLDSPLVEWNSVQDFRFSYEASQHVFRKNVPRLQTPFRVIGGWAFLWRYPDRDKAIYIVPGTAWGSLGDVKIKEGTKREPRFLVEAAVPKSYISKPKAGIARGRTGRK